MADKKLSDTLAEQEKLLRDEINDFDTAAKTAKNIAALNKKKDELQKDINTYLNTPRPDAGTIRRMVAGLSPFSPVNASYNASKDMSGFGNSLQTFFSSYLKDIQNNLKTAKSGKDYTLGQKTGKDLLTLGGMKDGWMKSVAGFGLDVFLDPTTFGAMKPVFKTIGKMGSMSVDLASKVPQVEKGIEGLKSRFNLFYEIEKSMPTAEVEAFKSDFRLAVNGNMDALKKWSSSATQEVQEVVMGTHPRFYEGKRALEDIEGAIAGAKTKYVSLLEQQYNKLGEQFDPTKLEKPVQEAKNIWTELIAQKNNITAWLKKAEDYAKIPKIIPASYNKIIPKDAGNVYDRIISEAFGSAEKTGPIGSTLDWTAGIYKKLMSYSPRFKTRNFMGAMTQGTIEGAGPEGYWNALKLMFTKGSGNSDFYANLQKNGVMTQPGMFEQTSGFMAKIDSAGEALNRTALVWTDVYKKGMSFEKAVSHSEDVFYKYNKVYQTAFEKNVVGRALPFYSFQKGQFSYFPEAMGRNASIYSNLGKVTSATAPQSTKDYPWLTPDWFKDQLGIGSVRNWGFQLEDFLKNATGDIKNLWSQLQPVLKGVFELGTDWNVFKGKSISGDTGMEQYKNMGKTVQTLLGQGFAGQNTLNPYYKYLMESAFGPLLQVIKNAVDPKKSILSTVTSIRDYDVSLTSMRAQSEMNQRSQQNGGFWANLANRFGFGTSSASAAVPVTFVGAGGSGANKPNSDFVAEWANRNHISPDKFGKEFVYGDKMGEQTFFYNASQNAGKMLADSLKFSSTDMGKDAALSFQQNMANVQAQAKFQNWGEDTVNKVLAAETAKYNTLKPRLIGGDTLFHPGDFKYRPLVGGDPLQQAYNKGLEERAEFASKTATLWKQVIPDTPDGIRKSAQAELAALQMRLAAQYGGIDNKMVASRMSVINADMEKKLKELEGKSEVAIGNIIEHWAKTEIDGVNKIELERQAAIRKYHGSEDYLSFPQLRAQTEESIDREYEQKKRDRLALEAKENLEMVKTMTKGEAENTIAALEGIYKRGGMAIEEFYTQKLIAQTKEYLAQASAAIDEMQIQIQSAMGSKSATAEDKTALQTSAAKLNDLKSYLSSGNADPSEALKKMQEVFATLTFPGIDIKTFKSILSAFSGSANELQGAVQDKGINIKKDTDTLNKALAEINEQTAKIRREVFATQSTSTLGIKSFSGVQGVRYGLNSQVYTPKNYDANKEELNAKLKEHAQSSYQDLLAIDKDIPASDFKIYAKNANESVETYMSRMAQAFAEEESNQAEHEERMNALSDTGAAKYNAIKDRIVNNELKRAEIINQSDAALMQRRLQVAGDMASTLEQIGETIYNATNKQSKEAFYIMKAAALAEAVIKGYGAVISAYNAGMSVGGSYAPVVASAYAAAATAFVGAQVGIITSAMVNGKAEGGPIEGGSGTKDDVPIMAMKDEYVIRQSSARKYGRNFLDALNKGLIPVSALNFSLPDLPETSGHQTHFADGGAVNSAPATPITVQLKNESGTQLKQTKSETTFDGQQYVVTVFLDAANRNVGGLRDLLTQGK